MLYVAGLVFLLVLTAVVLITGRHVIFASAGTHEELPTEPSPPPNDATYPFADGPAGKVNIPFSDSCAIIKETAIHSKRAVVVDMSAGVQGAPLVVASRLGDEKMYPASMTKVMTMIVVVEHLAYQESLQDKITVHKDTVAAMTKAGASGMKLEAGEVLSVESLLYMLMLQSDGVAACELARYTAGSEAAFVQMMNQKAAAMGLENTHFANPTGLHDKENYSTCRDMAILMAYAMNMKLCRQIMSTESYTVDCVSAEGKAFHYYPVHSLLVTRMQREHPNERPKSVRVIAGKTGYTGDVSGYCLVTYAVSDDGHAWICVTSQANSGAECLWDFITLYDGYARSTASSR